MANTKKCDICRREFTEAATVAKLRIEWNYGYGGTYEEYNMCMACRNVIRDHIDKDIHNARYAALHGKEETE